MPPLLLVLGLFSVRIALAGIARPGRDELAYWYWAWHSLDAGYSLVTLSAVRISTTLCGDGAWAMRLPGLLAGVASAFLFHRIARRGGGDPGTAAWLTLAFVASPWQGYVGGVVHPDAFLGLGLLLFADGVTAGERRGAGRIATGACLAGLSKLTGALLLPVAAVTLLRRGGTRGRRIAAAGALLLVAGLFAVSVQPGTLRGVEQLGTFAVGTPRGAVLALGLLEAMVLAGPALVGLAAAGVRVGRGPLRWLAASWIAFHVAFALLGQSKGNWYLPAFVALAAAAAVGAVGAVGAVEAAVPGGRGSGRPATATPGGRHVPGWLPPAAVASAALSLTLATLAVLGAGSARDGTTHLPVALDRSYARHVGAREAEVSGARTWSERFAEYVAVPPDVRWPEDVPPGSIRLVGHDYGLLCGLAHSIGRSAGILLPWDPVFTPEVHPIRPGEDVLWVDPAPPPSAWASGFRRAEVVPPANESALVVYHLQHWMGLPSDPPPSDRKGTRP
jgi:hypothetical protein